MDFCYFLFLLGFWKQNQWKLKVWTIVNYFQGKKVQCQAYFHNFIHTLCTYVNWTYPGIRKYYLQQGLRLQQDHTVFCHKRLWTLLFYFIIIPLLPCINLYPTDFMTEPICFMLTTEVGQSRFYCKEKKKWASLQLFHFNCVSEEAQKVGLNSGAIGTAQAHETRTGGRWTGTHIVLKLRVGQTPPFRQLQHHTFSRRLCTN